MIEKCRSKPSAHIGHRAGAAYFIFQCHMIARLDDIINFKLEDLTANIGHSYTIKSKMRWVKYVLARAQRESRSDDIWIHGLGILRSGLFSTTS